MIEVDGDLRDHQPIEDAAHTAYLEEPGYRVLRFRNEEILYRLDDVLSRIANASAGADRQPRRPDSPSRSISPEMEREGIGGR